MEIVNFTPIPSLIGGLIIGLSATVLLYWNGRIAGISGISKGILKKNIQGDTLWRILFLTGLILGGFFYTQFAGYELSAKTLNISWTKLTIAAALVGTGTALGNGCTSGHGICGLSRKSIRSLSATLVFMLFGFITVFFLK